MSAGMMLLSIAAVLVFCGLLQRVLDRMYLTDRQALLIIGAMLLATLFPNITFGPIAVNFGGAIIPLGVCAYLLIKANTTVERWRTILGTIFTAAAVYVLSVLLPAEAEALPFDPMWVYGLCGGMLAWLLGRSRRAAFVCGVAGVVLADIVSALVTGIQGYQMQLVLGGAGIADATVISGMIGVFMCELVGEIVERFVRKHSRLEGHEH